MILDVLYCIFVMPIQMFVEIVYIVMESLLGSKGLALIGVSLVVQTLILPLYKRADDLQLKEREKQQEMSKWVNHIKKTFKSDEKFMMLQTYYRQQNYKTYYSLISSFSILLQIPFFLAAYNYLSNLQELKSTSFLIIKDLGRPDSMVVILGFTVNALPILMTVFNIISGIIYTKGLPLKAKLQVYILALVFLVLLYNSPAGLVLYWTMNNLYSLMKNVLSKLVKVKVHKDFKLPSIIGNAELGKSMFYLETFLLTAIVGALIPTMVISASAIEFAANNISPAWLVVRTFSIYAGLFLVWFLVFYKLMREGGKKLFSIVLFMVCIGACVNTFFFGKVMSGTMSYKLVYDDSPSVRVSMILTNAIVLLIILMISLILICKVPRIAKAFVQIGIISVLLLVVRNSYTIHGQMQDYRDSLEYAASGEIFSLSSKGENVVVLMLDRGAGAYLPYALKECPELKDVLDGFTYYPNTVAYSGHTNYSSPALFGGYEYTPTNMDNRGGELLVDKHNEALKVMPVMFANEGYDVVVCDPPYANYKWSYDVSIYDDCEGVSAYVQEGVYDELEKKYRNKSDVIIQENNFVYYSMMKVMPALCQKTIYNGGKYLSTYYNDVEMNEVSGDFVNRFAALMSYPEITRINDDSKGAFIMLQNSVNHDVIMLDENYMPNGDINANDVIDKYSEMTIDGRTMVFDDRLQVAQFQDLIASLKGLGKWLDFMRDNGVYDNTRIIIVADHGAKRDQITGLKLDDGQDIERFIPIMLVKDYNSKGFNISNEFMTIADVPTLATKDVLSNPINPFTGKLISDEDKKYPQRITSGTVFDVNDNNGYTFLTDGALWYNVEKNVYDLKNWKAEK